MNRKADFLQSESIRITNRIDSNREFECCNRKSYSLIKRNRRRDALMAVLAQNRIWHPLTSRSRTATWLLPASGSSLFRIVPRRVVQVVSW